MVDSLSSNLLILTNFSLDESCLRLQFEAGCTLEPNALRVPVRARFLKNLCLPLAILLLLALSLTLLLKLSLRNQEPTKPVEEEAEEWTTEDGRQEWVQDQVARQDRAIVYLANRSSLKELALSVELLFRVFNDRFRYRFKLIA